MSGSPSSMASARPSVDLPLPAGPSTVTMRAPLIAARGGRGRRWRGARRPRRSSSVRVAPSAEVVERDRDRPLVRQRSTTGLPTAAKSRRTTRLRPSPITTSTTHSPTRSASRMRAGPSSSITPSSRSHELSVGDRRLRRDPVRLVDAVARMGDAVGELAVAGEQQQPPAVGVEAADGHQPGDVRHQVTHGATALRVAHGGEHACRLVEGQRHRAGGARLRPARRRPPRCPR